LAAGKRVFKLKTFDRWAKGVLADADLCKAAREVMAGQFEADLGGGICKKRVAASGRGKSGSSRTLIAIKHQAALFFLAGRQKSDPGMDFSDKEVAAAKIIAKGLQSMAAMKIDELLAAGTIREICHEPPESKPKK
jgi:hypothetical protein